MCFAFERPGVEHSSPSSGSAEPGRAQRAPCARNLLTLGGFLRSLHDSGTSGTEITSFSLSQNRQGQCGSLGPQITDAAIDDTSSSARSQAWVGVPLRLGKDPTLTSLICTRGGGRGTMEGGTWHSVLNKGSPVQAPRLQPGPSAPSLCEEGIQPLWGSGDAKSHGDPAATPRGAFSIMPGTQENR